MEKEPHSYKKMKNKRYLIIRVFKLYKGTCLQISKNDWQVQPLTL